MHKRKSVCDAHAKTIWELAAAGRTVTEAADELGISRPTLDHWVKREGIEFTKHVGNTATPKSKPVPTGAVSREEILEAQLKELRAAVSKDRRASVAQERIIQAVESALTTYEPPTVYTTPPVERPAGKAHHRQLVMLSDFHGGERVNRKAVNGLNEYDWDIMLARVDEVIDSLISFKNNSPALTGLDVLFIGDMCSGSNHEELARTNVYPLAEQGVKMGYVKASILQRLSPHYADLRCLSVEGNHPRLSKKPAAKQSHDNMDWVAAIIAKEAARGLKNLSEFSVGAGAEFWEIAGRTCYVWHGDGITSNMPGVPWGGVSRRTNEIQASFPDIRIDHFLFGHYHQANIVRSGRLLGNGALKGTDEWCQKKFGGGDRPTQLLLTFDEKRKRMTQVQYITPTAGL